MREKANALRAGALALFLGAALGNASAQDDAKRGEYLAKAGGCVGCHTEEKEGAVSFAGGRELKTPFGTFYGPNITPHPQAGIGRWTEADFIRAMRLGDRPDGKNYFPAFPYPSFTKISDPDLRDLWAYLRSLPPSARANQEHDLTFPFGWRFLVTFWKWFFFTPGALMKIQGSPISPTAALTSSRRWGTAASAIHRAISSADRSATAFSAEARDPTARTRRISRRRGSAS